MGFRHSCIRIGQRYWHTSKSGRVDREQLTQFGWAMEQLGVEMIAGIARRREGAASAGTERGRVGWSTSCGWRDRERSRSQSLHSGGVFTGNEPEVRGAAAEAGSAFVRARGADLDRIFAWRSERQVAADNTVRVNKLVLQIEKSPYRTSFARCQVEVFQHLDGTYSVDWQHRCVGRYDVEGKKLLAGPPPVPQRGKRQPGMPEGERPKGEIRATPKKREPCGSPSVYAPE